MFEKNYFFHRENTKFHSLIIIYYQSIKIVKLCNKFVRKNIHNFIYPFSFSFFFSVKKILKNIQSKNRNRVKRILELIRNVDKIITMEIWIVTIFFYPIEIVSREDSPCKLYPSKVDSEALLFDPPTEP